jgi:hypothetical protein
LVGVEGGHLAITAEPHFSKVTLLNLAFQHISWPEI